MRTNQVEPVEHNTRSQDASGAAQVVARAVFSYLLRAVRERATPVRDSDRYESVVWFSEVPVDEACYAFTRDDGEAEVERRWLTVRRPVERQEPPSPPVELQPWLPRDRLSDPSQLPGPMETLEVDDPTNASGTRVVRWPGSEDLAAAYEEYVDNKWLPWAEREGRWRPVRELYGRLHTIWLDLDKRSEEVELVLGCGFLTWACGQKYQARRHLLTCRATITLDPKNGALNVRPAEDASKPVLEEDMLDPEDRPHGSDASAAREAIEQIEPAYIDSSAVGDHLAGWLASLHAEARFLPDDNPLSKCTSIPTVSFAPALILRRRSQRSWVQMLNTIVEQVSAGGSIPRALLPLCDATAEGQASDVEGHPSDVPAPSAGEPLLPLPSNAEQERIIRLIQSRNGLLVQGPPGTGKSHTIANLICHFLAAGKRVLVTSQGPRALRVLMEKLPPDIRPLCVSVLGADLRSRQELDRAVQGITARQSTWDQHDAQRKLKAARDRLENARSEEAKLQRRAIEIMQKDTYVHSIAGAQYSGTAMDIAKRIEVEIEHYAWYRDGIPTYSDASAVQATCRRLLAAIREAGQTTSEVSGARVSAGQIPDAAAFRALCDDLRAKHTEFELIGDAKGHPAYPALARADDRAVERFRSRLLALGRQLAQIRTSEWVLRAASDALVRNAARWSHLRDVSAELDELAEAAKRIGSTRLALPDGHTSDEMWLDLPVLEEHLRSGRVLRFVHVVTSPRIRRVSYLMSARLADERCDTPGRLSKLREVLRVDLGLAAIERDWESLIGKAQGSLVARAAILANAAQLLKGAFEFADAAQQTAEALLEMGCPVIFAWTDTETVTQLVHTCDCVIANRELVRAQSSITAILDLCDGATVGGQAHPLSQRLRDAVVSQDPTAYGRCYDELRLLDDIGSLRTELAEICPCLVEELVQTANSPQWDERLDCLPQALRWAEARAWLDDYLADASDDDFCERLRESHAEVGRLTADVAAKEAWRWCLSRLTEPQRQALSAWKTAMRQVGKGTGKSAARYRQAARQHLTECSGAIPAWIMPLHSVVETVRPNPGIYDVVIVDEASQCGPEALFLFYIARKVLVVGDDQQISPDNVGLEENRIVALQSEELTQVPERLRTALDLRASLFSIAEYAYRDRVVLREHFRCMPEIIEFSNDLCYRPHGVELVPLRQYAADRLPPIQTCHVSGGYREGSGKDPVNREEAKALVEGLHACHVSHAYKGKSFGVISLLGERQAQEIERMLRDRLGPEAYAQRQLRCGDAYRFQGDERDVMFISMVASPGETRLTAQTAERYRQRYNVAVSRARDQVWLYHTATINDIPSPECMRRRLLEYCQRALTNAGQIVGINAASLEGELRAEPRDRIPKGFDSRFEAEVALDIARRGYRVVPHYSLPPYTVDMVIEGPEGRRVAVECDGDRFHPPEQYEQDLIRERILSRAGLVFVRVRGSKYYRDRAGALEPLWTCLREVGIHAGAPGLGPGTDLHPWRTQSEASDVCTDVDEPGEHEDLNGVHRGGKPGSHWDRITPLEWREAILEVLRACPNHSCTRDSVTPRVLKLRRIQTRGGPWRECDRRIGHALRALLRDGRVEQYRATNVRVRLRKEPNRSCPP